MPDLTRDWVTWFGALVERKAEPFEPTAPTGTTGRAWRSNLADVVLFDRGGFAPVPGTGAEVTRLPLWDAKHGVFARLTYRDALAAAQAHGARLGSTTEYDKLHAAGFEPTPCIGGLTAAEKSAAKAAGISERDAFGAGMVSLEWARRHDACLFKKLATWDGQKPVSNAGKQWIGGAPAGRALNYGWYSTAAPNGRMWQGLGKVHDDAHHDYSQLTMLWRGGSGPTVPGSFPGGGGGGGAPTLPPLPDSIASRLPGWAPPIVGPMGDGAAAAGDRANSAAWTVGLLAVAAGLYYLTRTPSP